MIHILFWIAVVAISSANGQGRPPSRTGAAPVDPAPVAAIPVPQAAPVAISAPIAAAPTNPQPPSGGGVPPTSTGSSAPSITDINNAAPSQIGSGGSIIGPVVGRRHRRSGSGCVDRWIDHLDPKKEEKQPKGSKSYTCRGAPKDRKATKREAS
jgi:hypothetical protein